MICKSDDGILIYCESDHAPKARASLLVVHGIGEHSGRYDELAARAKKMKLDVHRVDLRGHGRSNGIRGHVDNFSDYHRDLEAWIQHLENSGELRKDIPCFLLGHSLGGLVALTYLVNRKPRPLSTEIAGLVLASPALGLRPTLMRTLEKNLVKHVPKLLRNIQVPNGIKPETLTHDKTAVANYKEDPLVHHWATPAFFAAMTRTIRRLPKILTKIQVPILFLLAGDDLAVDTAAAEKFADRLASLRPELVTKKTFHGFYHELFNETKRDRVYLELRKWLEICLTANRSSSKSSSKFSKRGVTERATLH